MRRRSLSVLLFVCHFPNISQPCNWFLIFFLLHCIRTWTCGVRKEASLLACYCHIRSVTVLSQISLFKSEEKPKKAWSYSELKLSEVLLDGTSEQSFFLDTSETTLSLSSLLSAYVLKLSIICLWQTELQLRGNTGTTLLFTFHALASNLPNHFDCNCREKGKQPRCEQC